MKEDFSKLQAGDYVILHRRWGEDLVEVERITPTGLLRIDGYLYHNNGERKNYGADRIELYTEDKYLQYKEKQRQKEVIHKAFKIMRDTKRMDYRTALEIIRLLEEQPSG